MNPTDILKAIRDYGINAILVVAVIWMNSRVNEVELKLYDCFQHRIDEKWRNFYPNPQVTSMKNFAILPEEIKIRKG